MCTIKSDLMKSIMMKLKMLFVVVLLSAGGAVMAKADDGLIIIENKPTDPPAWSEAFEEADINNTALVEFLTQKIIPYFKRAGNKGEHRIYIYFRDLEDNEICGEYVKIVAEKNCEYCNYLDYELNNPKEHNTTYVTLIDNIVIFLIDETKELSSKFIKPSGNRYKTNPVYWKKYLCISESDGEWELIATKDQIHRIWFYPGEGGLFSKWKEEQQRKTN